MVWGGQGSPGEHTLLLPQALSAWHLSPEHIQRIMTLEESVQQVVMEAIQEVKAQRT